VCFVFCGHGKQQQLPEARQSRGWGLAPGGEGGGTSAGQILLVHTARDPQLRGSFPERVKCMFAVLQLYSLTFFLSITTFFSYSRVDPYVRRSTFMHQ